MATLQQISPSPLQPGHSAARETRNSFSAESRPYLITGSPRKTVKSTQQYLALFPHESEDARLTGSTRSLYRRLLALNLHKDRTRSEADTLAISETVLGSRIA